MSDQKPSSSHEPPSTSVGNGGIVAELPDGVGFAAVPLLTCPHLRFVERIPEFGINAQLPCATCNDLSENWICLTCYTVNCSRFVNEHALQHYNVHTFSNTLIFGIKYFRRKIIR